MNPKLFNRVFVALTLLLTIFYAFWLGADINAGDTKEAIADGILLAFWLFAFVFFGAMTAFENKAERELEESSRKLDKAMGELLSKLKADHDHDARLEDALEQATAEIKKGSTSPLKPSQYPAIEKRFHELTGDHYLKLEKAANGKADVTISDVPFQKPARKKPATKTTPVKKTVTKKKGTK